MKVVHIEFSNFQNLQARTTVQLKTCMPNGVIRMPRYSYYM